MVNFGPFANWLIKLATAIVICWSSDLAFFKVHNTSALYLEGLMKETGFSLGFFFLALGFAAFVYIYLQGNSAKPIFLAFLMRVVIR